MAGVLRRDENRMIPAMWRVPMPKHLWSARSVASFM